MFAFLSSGTELRRFRKGVLPKIALVVLLFIPLIYGALYLWAFWAPTDEMKNLPVALVNEDAGATRNGERLTAGDDLVTELTDRGDLDWQLTDATDATTGVQDGDYYFSVTIPDDFSANAVSVGGDQPTPATVEVEYNDANSFLASTLGKQAMVQLRDTVAEQVSRQTADTMLVGISDASDGIRAAADGANTLADGLATADAGAGRLVVGLGDLSSGAGALDAGAIRLADGSGTLADGLDQLAAGAGSLSSGAGTLAGGLGQLATGAGTLSSGTSTLAGGLDQLATGAGGLSSGATKVADGAGALSTQLGAAADGAGQLATGSHQLADGAGQIATQTEQFAGGSAHVSGSIAELLAAAQANPDVPVSAYLDALQQAADGAATLDAGAQAAVPQVQGYAANSTAFAGKVDALAAGLTAGAPKAAELADGAAQLRDGTAALAQKSGDAASGAHELASGAATLAQKSGDAASGATTLATGATNLASTSGDAASGAHTVADGAAQLRAGAGDLADGASKLDDGGTTLAAGAGKLADGSRTLADELGAGAASAPVMSESDIESKADVIAAPVQLDESSQNAASSFGEGFAPFFIALATFVGGLIMWLILRALPTRALAASASGLRAVMTGFLPAMAIGLGQVVIMVLVLVYGIGLEPEYWLATSAFIYLVTLAFLALQQMFIIVLGTAAGRVVSLVLLMLQLSSSGGTYPVETTPGFFQVLHPFMPASYVVSGLRELITGGVDSRLWLSVLVMAGILVGSLAISAWSAGKQRMWSVSRLHPELAI
ncbi:YhgE/Pip domain-containing protein [Agromyces italicus]|uniref:YhgE/Pip domain-containing protein n=1 Tax=Agromyces italicus TaxID=279572 RepID=UPI0003B68479|nr:YhgE/Pip domain-containing protein [Agromyces italicus]